MYNDQAKTPFQSKAISNLYWQTLLSIHFRPATPTITPGQAPPASPPDTPPARAQPPALSAPSVTAAVPQPPLHVFIPANTPPDARTSAPILQNPTSYFSP